MSLTYKTTFIVNLANFVLYPFFLFFRDILLFSIVIDSVKDIFTRKEDLMRLANLKNDYAFKYVYGAGTEKSNAALIGLLSVFLKRKVIRVAVQNPELIMPDPKEKEPVVDILVTFDDGDRVDVEMQASMVNDYLFKRFEYYLCRIHSKQQIKGQKYYKLKKSIVLAFVDGYW